MFNYSLEIGQQIQIANNIYIVEDLAVDDKNNELALLRNIETNKYIWNTVNNLEVIR